MSNHHLYWPRVIVLAYGQSVLEQAELTGLDDDLVDQIFDFQIRDFTAPAIALHGKTSSTEAQQQRTLSAVRKPVADRGRFDPVWEQVRAYDGAYEMAVGDTQVLTQAGHVAVASSDAPAPKLATIEVSYSDLLNQRQIQGDVSLGVR